MQETEIFLLIVPFYCERARTCAFLYPLIAPMITESHIIRAQNVPFFPFGKKDDPGSTH